MIITTKQMGLMGGGKRRTYQRQAFSGCNSCGGGFKGWFDSVTRFPLYWMVEMPIQVASNIAEVISSGGVSNQDVNSWNLVNPQTGKKSPGPTPPPVFYEARRKWGQWGSEAVDSVVDDLNPIADVAKNTDWTMILLVGFVAFLIIKKL